MEGEVHNVIAVDLGNNDDARSRRGAVIYTVVTRAQDAALAIASADVTMILGPGRTGEKRIGLFSNSPRPPAATLS